MNDDLTRAQVQFRQRNALKTLIKPVSKSKRKPKIAEDDPRWNGNTMGNKRVGPGYRAPKRGPQ